MRSKTARPVLVVRYNWIESGNRQLDLVDGETAFRSGRTPLITRPLFTETF